MLQPTTTMQSSGRAVLLRLATAVAVLIGFLAVLDVVLRIVAPASGAFQVAVDVQTPATLYAKVEELRKAEGVKVAVLGDSLIFGRAMRDKGDKAWQAHTLSSQLQRWLAEKHPGRPVSVSNFGMNGTLPADLDNLVRIVLAAKPDVVVFDLSLRSFSRDFDRDGDLRTRDWLDALRVSDDGTYSTAGRGIVKWSQDQLINHWFLYRSRDFFQALLFDGSPLNFLTGLRDQADKWFRGSKKTAEDDLGDVVLLMRARSRYEKIDLAADNPQRQALDRVLQRLAAVKQPTLIFYATENPSVLPELLPRAKFDELQGQLAQIISSQSPGGVFVGPLAIYPAADFLDHVHLNEAGYRRLTEVLGPRINDLILQRKTR